MSKNNVLKLVFNKFIRYKKTVLFITLSAIAIGYYIKSNQYIVDPNHKLYKQFEWATWEDSAGGRMAHDPKWLAMVPDKYIPKEVPFEFTFKEKYFTPAHEKRRKYYNHLCETEAVSYMRNDYPEHMKNSEYHLEMNTFIYINRGQFPVKGMKELYDIAESEDSHKKEKQEAKEKIKKIWTITQQNPYMYNNFKHSIPILKEGKVYDLFLREFKNEFYETQKSILPTKTTFREYLDNEGYVWRARYDADLKIYLPIEKDRTIKAQYYIFSKIEQSEEMKKLGIWKSSAFTIDVKNQRVMSYGKAFTMPSYLSSLRGSTFQLPIDWNSLAFCPDSTIKRYTIKNFE